MTMSSLEYKGLLNRFGADVREINDDLYQARQPDASPEQREAVGQAAERKLEEYDRLLAQLEGSQRAHAESRFGELLSAMRSSAAKLQRGGG